MIYKLVVYSTKQAAKMVGITRVTLNRWIADGEFKPPPMRILASVQARVWSKSDVEKLKRFKLKRYKKGQGKRTDLA